MGGTTERIISNLVNRTKGLNDIYDDVTTSDTVVDGIQTDLSNATDGLGALKTAVDGVETKVDTAITNVGTVDTVVDGIQTDLSNATDGLGALKSDIGTVDTAVGGIQTDLSNTTDGLGALKSDIGTVDTAVGGIQTDLSNSTDGLGALKADLGTVVANVAAYLSVAHIAPMCAAIDTGVWTIVGDNTPVFAVDASHGECGFYMITSGTGGNTSYIRPVSRLFETFGVGYDTLTFSTRGSFVTSLAYSSAFIGLSLSALGSYSLPNTPCAHFYRNSDNSNNWFCRSYNGSAETTDSGVIGSLSPQDFEIVLTAGSVLFYINGSLVATHTAQVPSGCLVLEYLIQSNGAAARYIVINSKVVYS